MTLEYVLKTNSKYVIELLVSIDNFYIIDDFNLQMDMFSKRIKYIKLYSEYIFYESLKNIDYVIDLYLNFKNSEIVYIDHFDMITYFSYGVHFKSLLYLPLLNYFKYKMHINEPILDEGKLEANKYNSYLIHEKINVDFNQQSCVTKAYPCKYSYINILKNCSENFVETWSIIEEIDLYKKYIDKQLIQQMTLTANEIHILNGIDDNDYITEDTHYDDYYDDYYRDRASGYYEDDLDMDQQGQEFWDNI